MEEPAMTPNHSQKHQREFDRPHSVQTIENEHRSLHDLLKVVAAAGTSTALFDALTALPRLLGEHFAAEEKIDGMHVGRSAETSSRDFRSARLASKRTPVHP
jgi:hypothetical protein